ncbi:MAG: TlpA family protein disulfide reductase [Bacteroidetes bacterium]|nr:TlpA family protein disulfide reductase [Bacteroidota bacterium]
MRGLIYTISILLISHLTHAQLPDARGYIVKVGDVVPNIEFELIDGTTTSIDDLRGKVIMLQFTASWCKVCREEMPHIEKEVWKVFKDQGLVIIGVDRDEPLEKVISFAKQMGVTYPMSLDPGANIFGVFADKKAGVTRNVIINAKGEIIFLTRLFEKAEFNEMKEVIEAELTKK